MIEGVSWNGKTGVYLIESATVTINSYIQILWEKFLQDYRSLYPDDNYIYQQDGAAAHTSNQTTNFLQEQTPTFIKRIE